MWSRVQMKVSIVSWCGLTVLLLASCARPVLTAGEPSPGAPTITAFEIVPSRIDSGCPITFRISYEDAGADVTRAVMQWSARTGPQRYHKRLELFPIATEELAGRRAGHADVTLVPPHAGHWVYRVQLEDAEGRKSNIAEAGVHVDLRPFWRQASCETPGAAPLQTSRHAS